jgi:hypothetical protein
MEGVLMDEQLFLLGAATIAQLDNGLAEAAFDKAIEQAIEDCIDRPADDRFRTVTLTLQLRPVSQTHGNTISCEGARGLYKVKLKRPDWESQELGFGVRKSKTGAMAVFSGVNPDDHRQGVFPEVAGDPEEG